MTAETAASKWREKECELSQIITASSDGQGISSPLDAGQESSETPGQSRGFDPRPRRRRGVAAFECLADEKHLVEIDEPRESPST